MKAFSLFVNDTQGNTRCSGLIQFMEKHKDDFCGHFECEHWKQDLFLIQLKRLFPRKKMGDPKFIGCQDIIIYTVLRIGMEEGN